MGSGTFGRWLSSEKLSIALCILAGLGCAWAGRYAMNPDGISYLDLGDALLQRDWAAATNAYWSPLYALLLGIAVHLVHPPIWWQFPLVHLVNFFIFVWSLLCFRYFMNQLLGGAEYKCEQPASVESARLPRWFLRSSGYALFLWCSLDLIGIQIVTPDLLLSSWIFLLAALLVRLRREASGARFLLFGGLLGAAYLSKSFMFPMAFVFLLVLFFSGQRSRRRTSNVLLAAAAFLAIATPLIAVLSQAKGRPTFSDAGRLTYAWLVSPQTPIINAQPEHAAELLHPTRKMMAHPPVYEFAGPIAGTYPPWYDPSYWNDGIRPQFHLRSQLQTVIRGIGVHSRLLLSEWGWLVGSLIFLLMGRRTILGGIREQWPLLLVTLVALGMYSLILVMPRYAAPFLAVFCFAVLAGMWRRQSSNPRTVNLVAAATLCVMLLALAQPLIAKSYRKWSEGRERNREEPVRAAEGLLRMGLHPNDRLAILGDGTSEYWARLAQVKIVAQIMLREGGGDEFWRLAPEERVPVYEALAGMGARALVTWDSTRPDLGKGWLRIAGTSYHVHFLLPDESSPPAVASRGK